MLFFSSIGLESGLSQISVLNICQDATGYMWFGTRNGLNRYDGTRMKVYKRDPEKQETLVDNQITALATEGDSIMWIGSMCGLNKMDLRTEQISAAGNDGLTMTGLGVRALCVDSRHRIWVGTLHGAYLYNQESQSYEKVVSSSVLDSASISDIKETKTGQIAICSDNRGVFISDRNLKEWKRYSADEPDRHLPTNDAENAFQDSHGNLWISTKTGGLSKINMEDDSIETFTSRNSDLFTNDVRCCVEMNGNLLIGTSEGIFILDPKDNSIVHSSSKRGQLSHFSVFSMCLDTSGGLWVGTYSGGVNYCSPFMDRFHFHNLSDVFSNMIGVYGPVIPDQDGKIYIGTEGDGLLYYDLKNSEAHSYQYDNANANSNRPGIIKSLFREGDVIWCGTWAGELFRFDIPTNRFTLVKQLPRGVSIYSILKDNDGNIWMATSKPDLGLVRIGTNGEMQSEFSVDGRQFRFPSARCISFMDPEHLMIGTRSNGLYIFNIKTHDLVRYGTAVEGEGHLPSDYVTSIAYASNGYFWVGLNEGGLAVINNNGNILKTLSVNDGLANNEVGMVVPDQDGNIWASCNGFISKYDPVSGAFVNYDVSVIGVQEFTPHCGALLPDGNICFSASKGVVSFYPDKLIINTFIPPVVINELNINNKVCPPAEWMQKNTLENKLKLKYNQNNLIISYCALNFVYSDLNQYAFKLAGHDKDWNYVGNRREAYYSKLRPGHYTFEVKGSNNDGIWNTDFQSLPIVITPPLWATWYAWLFYLTLAAFSLISFLRMIERRKLLEQRLAFKQKEQLQQEEFHQTKMRMYTNLSHELRTPLMLILSPLEEMMTGNSFPSEIRNKIGLIYNNAQRLNLLVDQLMDLRKAQSGKMKLKVVEDDLSMYIKEIYLAFKQIASSKGISLSFAGEDGHIRAWYDKFLMEKVIFNLLSNAIKNTPLGGNIVISLDYASLENVPHDFRKPLCDIPEDIPLLKIVVEDTGCGIPEEEIQHIFEPFYQVNSNPTLGTGIGLSLTSSVVHLHHGVIWAENNSDSGAALNVVFPSSKRLYKEEEIDASKGLGLADEVIPSSNTLTDIATDLRYKVLLVEDNEQVRNYIKESLEKYYDVLAADNGETAFEMVIKEFPDIVVSDVMMPRKDGLELCSEIKEDLRTGHIPVILMTAKSLARHVVEGLSMGADDYIVKPFSIDVLIYRIHNILVTRERLKKLYGKRFSPEAMGFEVTSVDERFSQKLFDIIEKNISNPDLNIDMICIEIGMSRSNLYRKLKAITELSPLDLIKNKRLEVAAGLLRESSFTISEVATYSGFNSNAYFASCFKAAFNCTPSEYMDKYRHNSNQDTI